VRSLGRRRVSIKSQFPVSSAPVREEEETEPAKFHRLKLRYAVVESRFSAVTSAMTQRSPEQQLASFIEKFTVEMAKRIRAARAKMRKRLPQGLS
jgi:hypothetical protein